MTGSDLDSSMKTHSKPLKSPATDEDIVNKNG